jgi:hypothetical protein
MGYTELKTGHRKASLVLHWAYSCFKGRAAFHPCYPPHPVTLTRVTTTSCPVCFLVPCSTLLSFPWYPHKIILELIHNMQVPHTLFHKRWPSIAQSHQPCDCPRDPMSHLCICFFRAPFESTPCQMTPACQPLPGSFGNYLTASHRNAQFGFTLFKA